MSLILFFLFLLFLASSRCIRKMSTSKLSTADCVSIWRKKKSAICVRVKRFILKMTNDVGTCLDAAWRLELTCLLLECPEFSLILNNPSKSTRTQPWKEKVHLKTASFKRKQPSWFNMADTGLHYSNLIIILLLLTSPQSSRGRFQIKARLIFECSKYLAISLQRCKKYWDYVYLSIKVYWSLARPINKSNIQLFSNWNWRLLFF